MKKVLYAGLSFLVFALLAMPAAAQKGHSNKSGTVRGNERAEEVQQMNKGAIAPGVEKAESKKQQKDHDGDRDKHKDKGRHKGKHKGKGRH